ncbi:MAG: phosphate acyltransferase PlsX [Ignavibacteriales bacterium]|nr:phosphate acyltransferase PlsX [Ignavibacteriales bacterium]MCB9219329.1 phosphate acyltransferase PlsX [Ignavibacteriales bacterium]
MSLTDRKCKIIVDAMGGDFVPINPTLGAIDALKENNSIEVFLIGDSEKINNILIEKNLEFNSSNIINAAEVIDMHDSPTDALKKKKDSSIVKGAQLVKELKADAFVSAGNTGAMMAASTLLIGRIPGFGRPTIGAQFPTETKKVCTVYDVGASVDSKPIHLLEYAIMGTIYAKVIDGIKNPTVGLLSVGEEESKGNSVTFETLDLLKNSKLNFVGNVEGRDILKGNVDIIVCDGFTGNIILKFGESFINFLKTRIRSYADEGILNKIKALITKNVFKDSLKDMDYQSHGGVPLLGVNGISIIGHGSSSPLAMKNMVLKANDMFQKDLIKKLKEGREYYGNL